MRKVRATLTESEMLDYFRSVGVIAPEAQAARLNLYLFLKRGNGAFRGNDEQGRITHTKNMQSRWVGKRVHSTSFGNDRYGTVKHLTARSGYSFRSAVQSKSDNTGTAVDPASVGAFEAYVIWENGDRPTVASMMFLEIVEEPVTVG